ncbi:MAG: formate acetyltransferase [Kiritimatiellae bacterium]|nr:formate acetyltransferase [Kiritimatiellia bacterium]
MRYAERMARLTARKISQTREKQERLGARDEDDYGLVLPPESFKVDLPVRDATGQWSGPRSWAANFRWLMENHPCYIDPDDAIAGRWMFMLSRMRLGYQLSRSNFAFDYSHLEPLQKKYDITTGIGKDAHFAPDYQIGLDLGWGGLLEKVRASRRKFEDVLNAESQSRRELKSNSASSRLCVEKSERESDALYAIELLEAEEQAILGVMTWTRRLAAAADDRAMTEDDSERHANLVEMARICYKIADAKPDTFREVVQWIAIFNMASRTYNRDGAGGQLDELLRPYYERDKAAGILTDEDAEFYCFCLLLNDPHYYQIGGPAADGRDQTSRMSYIILEAAAKLKSSCNLTIRVWDGMDRGLFRRGVEILLANRLGYPRFSGDKALVDGFMRNGYDASLARRRIAVGCNWMSLPGLEYTLNDVVKINIAKVFEVAFVESDSLESLEANYRRHFRAAVDVTAKGIDFHLAHQYLNEPELMLNLLSHGPIEKGKDVSHGGAEYYNMAIDGAGLAVVADSFGAIEQRVVKEKAVSFAELKAAVASNFDGEEGERICRLMESAGRYGAGGTDADRWAVKLTEILNGEIANHTTPDGFKLIPGWFTWADTLRFGRAVGATPNGRKAGEPISHGANPLPGFRKDGALTAMATSIASVQPGYGNTAPWQLEVDIGLAKDAEAVEKIMALIDGHFKLGGTLVNINVVDAEKILAAHKDPAKFPDLVVRVTGFTAYFNSLSPAFRELVVKRLVREAV